MSTTEREMDVLELELEEIRNGFLSVSDRVRSALAMAPAHLLDSELEALDGERKVLGSRFRRVRSRMHMIHAAA
jgi:hypothetical protein